MPAAAFPRWQHLLRPRARPLLCAAAVVLAALEVYADLGTWIELNVSIVYSLPLILAAAGRSRRLIWILTAVLLAASFVVYALQTPPGAFQPLESHFLDRLLASVTLLASAGLLHGLTVAVDALEARGERAERASVRKSRLLASVSHDVRTPLNTINLIADLIRHSATDPALAAGIPELAHTLQANALSLGTMIADVLDISAIDSGRVAVHDSEFVLDDLLEEECCALEPLATAKHLSLRFERRGEAVRVRTDKAKLARIVRNLVANAVKFTEAGSVTLAIARSAGTIAISVSDTGIGIAPENQQRIFGEFAQVDGATGGENRGWGLGLAISRRLAQLLGGDIGVRSTPGKGSTFIVRLPTPIRRCG